MTSAATTPFVLQPFRTLNEAHEALLRVEGARYNEHEKIVTISNVDKLWEWATRVKRELMILYLRFFIVDSTSDTAWLPISRTCMRWLLIGAHLQQFPPLSLRIVYHMLLTTHERTRELPLSTRLSEAKDGTLLMPTDLFKEPIDYDAPTITMGQVKRIVSYITRHFAASYDPKPATAPTTAAPLAAIVLPPSPVPAPTHNNNSLINYEMVPLFDWPIYGLTEEEEAIRDNLLSIGTPEAVAMASTVGQPVLSSSKYANLFIRQQPSS